jgi:xylitol oxidase
LAVNKRTFIKLSSATIASPAVLRLLAWAGVDKLTNWAGNLEYSTASLYAAKSLEQVQDFVKKQAKLKVLGSRHCFNNIGDSKDTFLSLKALDEIVSLDPQARTVTVGTGITYGQLSPLLHNKGFALHNLASLPHISVAGACTTATHGSGEKNGNLATAVSALELVTGSGEVVKLSRQKDGDLFKGGWTLRRARRITKITLIFSQPHDAPVCMISVTR